MNRCSRLVVVVGLLLLLIFSLYAARPVLPDPVQRQIPQVPQIQHERPWVPPPPPTSNDDVECRGPRGGRMDSAQSEDLPHPLSKLPSPPYMGPYMGDAYHEYPVPTYGSYDDLGLNKTWMTFAQRYGPYGYGEDGANYGRTKVDWSSINWGKLQDQCFLSQPDRTRGTQFLQVGAPPKFRFVHEASESKEPRVENTGRHAIVLRAWENYDYKQEDFWNIRSIITEASLANQGEYTVFLLVDVKRKGGEKIHEDDKFYQKVLEDIVPEEFWDIAVLFHESLQKSWYAKVNEYQAFFQIMQPLQLFAHFYCDFDSYWQIEMDTRFTGHVGEIARAFHKFGKEQPYKQSRERSSWTFMQSIHGSYKELAASVNKSLKGGAKIWGPINNGAWSWKPVASKPPVSNPKDDDFEYGVGSNADLILFGPLSDVLRVKTSEDWPFADWHAGVGADIPRFLSFPAQAWASRTLLEAIHTDQHNLGLRIHSEATLPTFALWHGLKVVQVPMPKFQFPERDPIELDLIYNGGSPTDFEDGIAYGPAPYRAGAIKFFARPRTFEWQSSLNGPIWDRWMNEKGNDDDDDDEGYGSGRRLVARARSHQGPIPDELPRFMRRIDGKVYMPPFMMHPRKTNKNI